MKNNNKHLSVHHIGARAGNRSFPFLRKFEKDIVNVLYDADKDCIDQIEEINQDRRARIHVLPYCIGGSCAETHFNINSDPNTSSLKEKNPDYDSYYFFNVNQDYILSEATRLMEKRPVEMKTIDHIYQSNNTPIPPPDFLSLDVQGVAYEVLQGAKETLKTKVLSVHVEVEFYPFYKDQKLFGDIVELLSGMGFDFVGFQNIGEMSSFRAPVGCRAQGFQMYADALFMRRITDLENVYPDEQKCCAMLQKLAYIAIVFNQFEYGMQCLSRIRNFGSKHLNTNASEEPVYNKFLKELEKEIDKVPPVYLETHDSKYTFDTSKLRYKTSDQRGTYEKYYFNAVKSLRQFPNMFQLLKQIRDSYVSMPPMTWCRRRSNVEKVLIKYGLRSQARILKKNRIVQSKYSRKNNRH